MNSTPQNHEVYDKFNREKLREEPGKLAPQKNHHLKIQPSPSSSPTEKKHKSQKIVI